MHECLAPSLGLPTEFECCSECGRLASQ